ncbi:uncharacterized protein JN550_004391 [Neoarthrinium moseri]|uniref:uncharacterized protein n=1 Tax=Neoarthrinium moseri TaxID=1658444 RepID=UPI001FDD08E8|nr:uncharacterized protein JN550_004391 [Neoarthrinium moseri]KAI1871397.1 hypothetical protein JN550_004391 [Neoarthrinium moseri]
MSKVTASQGSEMFHQVLDWYPELLDPIDRPVHHLITLQSGKHPNDLAVCSWDGELSYSDLDELSNLLASHVLSKASGVEFIVPLVFEKSKWMIVSVLAVLKAGGTFVMLDPSQPLGRLRAIVEQTLAVFAMASPDCIEIAESLVGDTFVVSETSMAASVAAASLPQVDISTAAYTIFTSGSTGTPKGVIIEHAQLATTSTYVGERLGYNNHSRVFQFASYAFDACLTDIFATLVHGGVVCIPSEWERSNAIIDAMKRMQVTHAKFTPSLASSLSIDEVSSLKTLMFGGESPSSSLVGKWAQRLKLILVYGPTECCVICFTTDATDHHIAPGEIGRPVAARGWIVKRDNADELAAIDEIGELLVEGPLVGRGYLHDPEKTMAQFIENPQWMPKSFAASRKRRLYRTGDLAKYQEDGRITYVGRLDNQVKIRGQRLELEEVEKILSKCLHELDLHSRHVVVEAVTFRELALKHLVAFLCFDNSLNYGSFEWGNQSMEIATSEPAQARFSGMTAKVKDEIRKLLPAYAIPSVWVPVSDLPYTISRKVDRKKIRTAAADFSIKDFSTFANPVSKRTQDDTIEHVSEQERNIRRMWADIFGISEASIESEDDFFSLGGDSVLAIKLIATARSSGFDLSLERVFKYPILREMASNSGTCVVEDQDLIDPAPFSLLEDLGPTTLVRQEAAQQCLVSIDAIEDIYPCSPMQEGLIALSMKDPGTYILQFVYQLPELVDIDRLQAAWEAVSKSIQVLRTRVFDYKSALLQVVVREPLRWKVVEADLADFLVAEKGLQMNVGEAMSRHSVVHQTRSQHYFLVWNVHHAFIDGWSESDVVILVEQAYFGDTSSLSKIPRFNRFIRYIGNQSTSTGETFWKEGLADAPRPTFPPLPHASYVPKVQRSSRILHHLESHADAEIQHRVRLEKRGNATPATMIQAAWFILIGLYSNTNDVITGVTLNGRAAPLPGIDQIPGPTVTTIPFRVRFSSKQRVSELLAGIQSQYLRILPHAQFGLQNIRALSDDAVAACKFRTLLVVQSANRPHGSQKLLMGRSYSFPVMDFALVMECELVKGNVEFRATFDHQILGEDQVRKMLALMENILQSIFKSTSTDTVGHLQELSRGNQSEIAYWHRRIAEQENRELQQLPKGGIKTSPRPSTPKEKKLATMWRELFNLHTEIINAGDHFFLLGGGSVSAMRLVSIARRQGLTLTVSDIFKRPILREMAMLAKENAITTTIPPFSLFPDVDLDRVLRQAASQCRVGVTEIEDILPAHAMQLHYVTGYPEAKRNINGPWDWQSQATYTLPPTINIEKFQLVWHRAVTRHQTLRTRAVNTDCGVIQAILKPPRDLRWRFSDELEQYLMLDRQENMTFGDDLLRLAIVDDIKSGTRYFIITLQHFIYDGFARQMLFKELETAYFDEVPDTKPPTMNGFIKYLMTANKQAALEYWTGYLANVRTKPLLDVPENCYKMNLKEESTTMNIPKFQGTEATLPTIIEVAGGLVLAHELGCHDVILYSDRSGRNLPVEGIQDLIGPTTLFLPVRIRFNKDQSLLDLLREAQLAQQEMLPHEHLGWLELREMAAFRHFYRHAINMNINPNALSSYDRLGLEYQGSHASCDDPFGINVDLYDDKIVWTIYFDERFIASEKVRELLSKFKNLLTRMMEAVDENCCVGQFLDEILPQDVRIG